MKTVSLLALIVASASVFAHAQAHEKVLWTFGSVPGDGGGPQGALISDSSGNLYGTAVAGGTNGGGTLFELSPQSDGTWTEAILYNFCSNFVNELCLDGGGPEGSLAFDSEGNLYGVAGGGASSVCGLSESACGVVFELSPPSAPGAAWTENVLYNFCSLTGCTDGWRPNGGLVFDTLGNLYGTTYGGGNGHQFGQVDDGGVVFRLSPGSGGWTETVLYNFCTKGSRKFCPDGSSPEAGVVFGPDGNLYGTTVSGGGKVNNALGVVYQLSPSSGGWSETVLFSQYFSQSFAPVSFNSGGNLFSTTQAAGFELNAKKRSSRSMQFAGIDGFNSEAGVLIDEGRNALFGTTQAGGQHGGGTLWEVTPSRQLVSIYDFCSLANCADGGAPTGNLIEDHAGNLYGTAYGGGAHGVGVVFQITPQ